jgi:inosine/xanthosine triphosphate pyrophosphatase family protein
MEYHKMTKPQIKEYNCETGIETIRDATTEEIAQIQLDAVSNATRKAEAEAKETQRQVILDRLGLTSDEARLLLGS